MRLRTAVVFILIFPGAGGLGIVAFTGDTGGTLTVNWMSSTARPTQLNHHPIVATRSNGQTYIAAPVSAVAGQRGNCILVMLTGNGSIRWRYSIADSACAIHGFGDPALVDFDGDERLEVLVSTTEERLYAFDAHTGEVELTYPLTAFGYSRPAVVTEPSRRVVVADFYGAVFALRPNGTTLWNRSLPETAVAAIQVGDFTGDQGPEIAIGTTTHLYVFDPDGDVVWSQPIPTQHLVTSRLNGTPVLFAAKGQTVTAVAGNGTVLWRTSPGVRPTIYASADGDGDGTRELYVGTRRGTVVALSAQTGAVEWKTTLASETLIPAPGVGDVDGDGSPEVVAVTNHGAVVVLDPTSGEVLASYHREGKIWVHPTITDYDGDGRAEILVMYGEGRVVSLSYHSTT